LLALRRAGFSVAQVVLGGHGQERSGGIPIYHVASIDDLDVWRRA
jgi:hypothetical protein